MTTKVQETRQQTVEMRDTKHNLGDFISPADSRIPIKYSLQTIPYSGGVTSANVDTPCFTTKNSLVFTPQNSLESTEKAATDRARRKHTRPKTDLGSIISSHVKEFGLRG